MKNRTRKLWTDAIAALQEIEREHEFADSEAEDSFERGRAGVEWAFAVEAVAHAEDTTENDSNDLAREQAGARRRR